MKDNGDLSDWSEAQLRRAAAAERCAQQGELGDWNPNKAHWQYVADFPVSHLAHLIDDWPGWLHAEITMDEEDELHRGYRAMLGEPIIEAIVVFMLEGKGYIWDGWHRTGITIVSGRSTLRAIVGTPMARKPGVSTLASSIA